MSVSLRRSNWLVYRLVHHSTKFKRLLSVLKFLFVFLQYENKRVRKDYDQMRSKLHNLTKALESVEANQNK